MVLRIYAQAQGAAVVIADRALRLPRRERAERYQLGDECRHWFTRARPSHLDLRPHGDAVEEIFTRVERQPLFPGCLDHEHRLASMDVLADLCDDHGDD